MAENEYLELLKSEDKFYLNRRSNLMDDIASKHFEEMALNPKSLISEKINFAKLFPGKQITKATTKETYNLIRDTIATFGSSVGKYHDRDNPENTPPEINELLDNFHKLTIEALDLQKSIGRGFRDLVRGDSLRTEMKGKIKDQLIDPLRDFINKEETETSISKEEANLMLDFIEDKYLSTSKGLGG